MTQIQIRIRRYGKSIRVCSCVLQQWKSHLVPAGTNIKKTMKTNLRRTNIAFVGSNVFAPEANSGDGYIDYSGTSMATPGAAGLAALMYQANPDLSPFDIRINTNGDGKSINVNIPFSHSQLGFAPVACH